MNRVIWRLRGYAAIRVKGSDIVRFLNGLTKQRIPFWELIWIDEVTVIMSIFLRDADEIEKLAASVLCEISVEESFGMGNFLKSLLARFVLLIGMVTGLSIILFSQQRLLFYEVVGNETVSSEEIMRTLEKHGIGVGTYGANIDTKKIKDHMIGDLPMLQWITVTQNGSAARVVVRERPEIPKITDRKGYANIVASHAGMITEQAVYEGQPLKKRGDIVTEGEMLVSGVVNLERIYAIVYAQAEIFAKTWREKRVVTPEICLNKAYTSDEYLCIWMEIGKHQIKIFGNSGISTTECDKIVKHKRLTLPGGYELPVTFFVETYLPYTTKERMIAFDEAHSMLQTYSEERTNAEMCAGSILDERTNLLCENGKYELFAQYECHEMIAKTVEGILKKEDFGND